MKRFLNGAALAAVVMLPLAAPAAAADDNYPNRPISVIVPFTPGASTDAVARLTRDPMSETLGQPIIIDNRPGAAGTTGSAIVANAKPDGYTLLVAVNAPLTMNMYLQKSFPFDARTAFAPVTLAAESILVLAVNSALPVRSVAELIDYAKKHPGTLSYGSAGVGSAHHIAGEILKQRTGIDMVHVPYRGSAPAMQDLVAGAIKVSFGTTPAVLPQAATGAIRIIALAEERRSPDLPDIPTIAETVPGVVTMTWVGLFAPAGTPAPIVEKLNKAMTAALQRPDVVAKLKIQGVTALGQPPDALARRMREEVAHWGRVIPSIGIQPE